MAEPEPGDDVHIYIYICIYILHVPLRDVHVVPYIVCPHQPLRYSSTGVMLRCFGSRIDPAGQCMGNPTPLKCLESALSFLFIVSRSATPTVGVYFRRPPTEWFLVRLSRSRCRAAAVGRDACHDLLRGTIVVSRVPTTVSEHWELHTFLCIS